MAVTIDMQTVDGAIVAAIAGRLDGAAAPEADESLSGLIGPQSTLIVDLAGLSYVSSAGLRVLLKLAKQAKGSKARLVLSGVTDGVKEVFEISGFTSIFSIYPDRGQALAALG